LEHHGDQIVNCFDVSWFGEGTAMSALKHQYLPTQTMLPGTGSSVQLTEASAAYGPALRYSSPWPWVLALTISSGIWVGIGWLIWKLL
jgi:hypothetical protein